MQLIKQNTCDGLSQTRQNCMSVNCGETHKLILYGIPYREEAYLQFPWQLYP